MATITISLPDALEDFVEEQATARGYGSSSAYVRALIRKDQDCQRLRSLLLDGMASAPSPPTGAAFFEDLRNKVRRRNTSQM